MQTDEVSWQDIDKVRYYSFGYAAFLLIRIPTHPFWVVKTRLQMQLEPAAAHAVPASLQSMRSLQMPVRASHRLNADVVYDGTFDAFKKMSRHEGVRSLFKGFGVGCVGILAMQLDNTVLEVSRHELMRLQTDSLVLSGFDFLCNSAAGALAALVSHTVSVRVEVLAQKQMMSRRKDGSYSATPPLMRVVKETWRKEGWRGFYRGFGASLLVHAPYNSVWWAAYIHFKSQLAQRMPAQGKGWRMAQEATAGGLAGVLAVYLTNPFDVVKTRMQLSEGQHRSSDFLSILRKLVRTEGLTSLLKGVEARALVSVQSSIMFVTAYELVKRMSKK